MVGCQRCGGRSRAGARYCGTCGALLGSARPGVRKTVTVLFAALRSDPASGADLEASVRQAAACFDAVSEVLHQHGAAVERSAGDAVMAVFGVPASRDDDARRAVAAGLALLRAELPGSPALSIGINSGEVLTGRPDDDQELAVGDAVVVAARLQQLAAPGEVLLGPATRDMVGPGLVLGEQRRVTLRGRVGELPVVPLLGLEDSAAPGPRSPFVGRDAERGLLLAAVDRTLRAGLPQLLTVLGEPGTGKSRLVREVLAERRDRVRVLRGTCRGYGGRTTWLPLLDLAAELLGLPLGTPAPQLRQAAAAVRPDLVPAAERGDLTEVVRELAAEQPLVVVVEDLHLAEPPLLALLEDLLRALEQVPLLVVATARPELVEAHPGWGRRLPHALGVTLRPLAEAPARRLAEHLLPGDPAGAAALLGPAAGNPLFLEQLAKARAEGTAAGAPSVSAVLAARLDRLPVETRQVLEAAAVIGSRGPVADLLALCGGEQEVDVDAELASLARRDLLHVVGGQWSFASELVREAATLGLTRADRAELHQVRALVLAARGGREAATFHVEEAARLLAPRQRSAEDPGDDVVGAVLTRRAPQRLARRLTGSGLA